MHLNAQDARQGYTTVFTPSIKYALPVSSIPQSKLDQIQRPTTNAVLSRLGYNPHMPRAVVFAAKTKGGIGLLNLSTEQGVSQVQLLMSHVRSKSYLHNTILILLETYQLVAGIPTSPLLDTSPRHYVDSKWLSSIRQFLHTTDATINIPNITNLIRNRTNDVPIMDNPTKNFSTSDLECINACRLFLQVTFLSEISNAEGTAILPEAIKGNTDNDAKPTLWQISTSKLQWPRQTNLTPI